MERPTNAGSGMSALEDGLAIVANTAGRVENLYAKSSSIGEERSLGESGVMPAE
jgi:hypothetical protein